MAKPFGVLSIAEADLVAIRPLLSPLNPGIDLTRLGSWIILPLCCGAFAGQSLSRKMSVFEAMQPQDAAMRLMAGDTPPDVLAMSFSNRLKEWIADPVGERLARRRLCAAYMAKGKTEADVPAYLVTWMRLAILLNSYKDLDTDEFMPIRAWADGNTDRWLELSFAAGLLLGIDEAFPYELLANGELAKASESYRTAACELFVERSRGWDV